MDAIVSRLRLFARVRSLNGDLPSGNINCICINLTQEPCVDPQYADFKLCRSNDKPDWCGISDVLSFNQFISAHKTLFFPCANLIVVKYYNYLIEGRPIEITDLNTFINVVVQVEEQCQKTLTKPL